MIIDEATLLVDGKGHTNVMDMGTSRTDGYASRFTGRNVEGTTGGHNSLSGWLNIAVTKAGTVEIQECDTEAGSYTTVPGATYTFAAAGEKSVPFPKTTKRFIKVKLTTVTASDATVFVGGLANEKVFA